MSHSSPLIIWSIEISAIESVLSSAKLQISLFSTSKKISLMKILNNSGPSTDPCGTQHGSLWDPTRILVGPSTDP